MPLQTISSGAFKFSTTVDNRRQTAIAGTMNISVDDDNNISGDFRIHDAQTPGGIPTPPAGTLTYMWTEKTCYVQDFYPTANGQATYVANTIEYGPFIAQDNVRVYLDDVAIDPQLEAFTTNYGGSSITITNADLLDTIYTETKNVVTNEITTQATKVTLKWLDDRVNGGISERDGWHFCDGRTLRKSEYAALYEAIGQSWNDMLTPAEVIADGFNLNIYHPFNEIKIIEGNGLFTQFDISYDENEPDNCIVWRRSPSQVQMNTWQQAERLVEGVHYEIENGKTLRTLSGNILDVRWELLILTKKPSSEFQIPDLRGYYLRAVGSISNRVDPNDATSPQKFGIQTKQDDTIKKHSHFVALSSAGSHTHDYQPWLFNKHTSGNWEPNMNKHDILESGCNRGRIHDNYEKGIWDTDLSPPRWVLKNESYNKLKAIRRGIGYHYYFHGHHKYYHRTHSSTARSYEDAHTNTDLTLEWWNLITKTNSSPQYPGDSSEPADRGNPWYMDWWHCRASDGDDHWKWNCDGDWTYSHEHGRYTPPRDTATRTHMGNHGHWMWHQWSNYQNPYFTKNETKDFYSLLGTNTSKDVAIDYPYSGDPNYNNGAIKNVGWEHQASTPIYAALYVNRGLFRTWHHLNMSKNGIEPRYFVLGAGPTDQIKPQDRDHYHEISTKSPDYSFHHTTPQSGNQAYQSEVDMPHIKLPIFIKY